MAASDQLYRSQRTLDIVFAVSCILMLVSLVIMFGQDYYRPYKEEQRTFRDVEAALAQRLALASLPSRFDVVRAEERVRRLKLTPEQIEEETATVKESLPKVKKSVKDAQKKTTGLEQKLKKSSGKKKEQVQQDLRVAQDELREAQFQLSLAEESLRELPRILPIATGRRDKLPGIVQDILRLKPLREKAEANYQGVKAELDSKVSFFDIEVVHRGKDSPKVGPLRKEIQSLEEQLTAVQAERDDYSTQIRLLQQQKERLEAPLTAAVVKLKKLNDEFDVQVKAAANKQWTVWDEVRRFPVLDAFASPIKIKQFTIDDIPIDYNFKYVTRFDRCMSCHLGIDRPAYTKGMLHSLREVTEEQKKRLEEAQEMLEKRRQTLEGLPELKDVPNPGDLSLRKLDKNYLTEARINQFCAHPRLDLFVGSNSPHPAEKFGCTSCHRGQGSATEFELAAHTPNTTHEEHKWTKEHGWGPTHDWDFPMLPKRFVESSCLKCHHEVTDLISADNRTEAPKLLKGYRVIREFGCYGCHEIKGRKYGRPIGPDLRLEPTPPLEEMAATERDRLLADPDNQPGTYRKVGPSLYRISEKTNPEWVVRWLRSPRSFRPDTRMPHFYGLSNNSPKVLPDRMKTFPDAEMQAITAYLFEESQTYLDTVKTLHSNPKDVPTLEQDQDRVAGLTMRPVPSLTKDEKVALEAAKTRLKYRRGADPIQPLPAYAEYKGDKKKGRDLFSLKGCLACHSHQATMQPGDGAPALPSEATHGPDLSQIKAKLGRKPGDQESARLWLMNWIKNPKNHFPRTRMPVIPHGDNMTDKDVIDVTVWLLDQDPNESVGQDWKTTQVPEPQTVVKLPDDTLKRLLKPDEDLDVVKAKLKKLAAGKKLQDSEFYQDLVSRMLNETYYDLANVYLSRMLPDELLTRLRKDRRLDAKYAADLPLDEKELVKDFSLKRVRHYVGKKAVSRLGCFGCHDVPNFDDAKPIGTELNDWGRKDPGRLDFGDAEEFVRKNYQVTPDLAHVEDEDTRLPYEQYFFDALKHHEREGFLHQKILNPRSFDYNKNKDTLKWDDLSRMPEFRFSHAKRRDQARINAEKKDEEEASESKTEKEESVADFKARKWRAEAEERDAVMTFVLGLVAEKVPLPSIYQPQGDRLAQVRGRQVLEKFNCNGCHLVQPGLYDIRLNESSRQYLDLANEQQKESLTEDYDFFDHHAWMGDPRKVGKDSWTALAVPKLTHFQHEFGEDKLAATSAGKKTRNILKLTLTEALRYYDHEGKPRDVRANQQLLLRTTDLLYPPPEALRSEKDFAEFEEHYGTFSGRFRDLLTKYVIETKGAKDDKYKGDANTGENILARSAAPPSLIGQGGRTQPGWLFNFLKNPEPVRTMVVLRMPQFNISDADAQTLVAYFTAVERLTNPRFQVKKGAAPLPQRAGLDEPYWRKRNQEYIKRLKQPDTKGNTPYEQRLKELQPLWERIHSDYQQESKETEKQLATIKNSLDAAEKAEKEAKTKLDAAQGDAQKKAADELFTQQQTMRLSLEKDKGTWEARLKTLQQLTTSATPAKLKTRWEEEDAYVVDAVRLLGSPGAPCVKCHQIGTRPPDDLSSGGPFLGLAEQRLQPNWLVHWVAYPHRLLPYPSPMPVNFPHDKPGQYQEMFVGSPKEQIHALNDVLMSYSRVMDMPISQHVIYPVVRAQPAAAGKDNDKKDNKKNNEKEK